MKKITKIWYKIRAVLVFLVVLAVSCWIFALSVKLQHPVVFFNDTGTVTLEILVLAILAHSVAMYEVDYLLPLADVEHIGKVLAHFLRFAFVLWGMGTFLMFCRAGILYLHVEFEWIKLFTVLFGNLLFISFLYHVYVKE